MATQAQPSRWRRFRVIFRRCRITLWLVVLVISGALLYLDLVGLPGFIKRPLVQKLHERGIDLQFTRVRLIPFRGIVAENVSFGDTNAAIPQLDLREFQIRLDYAALLKRQLQIESLELRQGRLAWQVADTNGPPRQLSIDHIQTDLELLTNNVWVLDDLQANFAGANFQLTGALTNASAIREWKVFNNTNPPLDPSALQNRLRRLADTLDKIHFAASPDFQLDIRGDARNVENLTIRLSLKTPDAETPWGTLKNANCTVLLAPPPSNQLARAEVTVCASDAVTRWLAVTNLNATLDLFSAEGMTNVVLADVDLMADSVQNRSNRANQVHFTAQWLHSLGNFSPLSGHGELHVTNALTPWGSARKLQLSATLRSPTAGPTPDASWAWWADFAPYPLQLEADATGVHSPKLDADDIFCSADWRAPNLSIQKLSATLYGGKLEGDAVLNIATRELTFNTASDFDGQKIAPLLTPQARSWLTNYSWVNPPQVHATGSLVLPVSVWTNRHPDWRGETRPSLQLAGQFHVVDGAFRGVQSQTADSHFTYSNMWWHLPDLVLTRPEGNLDLDYECNDRTQDYYYRVHSRIDPQILRPLFTPKQQHAFDLFSMPHPPLINGEIWGRWHHHSLIHATANLTVTNFSVRGESVASFQTALTYTNGTVTLLEPRIQRTNNEQLTASFVSLNLADKRILVTNGFSTADPAAVVHAIGPHVEREFKPYRFLQPPTVHVEGAIPIHEESDADLHFDLDGRALEWWKLLVPHITGKIDWVGRRLLLKDVQAPFYLGKADANAEFDFRDDNRSADFKFTLLATDANIHLLAQDLSGGKTNNLEGLVTTRIEITNANTADLQSAMGAGRVSLRDGLLWDIPIFGVFSPLLDGIMPGLGSSRAREGSATFTITNSVIHSDDVKIETLMARLRYWGTIDLQGNIHARMDAEPLRDTWVVGPVLSTVLWPVSKTFEYSITGSIGHPKTEPVYIPRILFLPMHPIQTLKDMVPPEETNSVPPTLPPKTSASGPG